MAIAATPMEALGAKVEEHILLPGQNPQGEYILSVLVKRAYEIRPGERCRRAAEPARLVKGDKHYGDPRTTPVEFEADLIPFKLATDVVVNGNAYAPGGRREPEVHCSVRVGPVRKRVVAIGDRTCTFRPNAAPLFSEPIPFASMPIRYDRAYGGVDIRSEPGMSYPYPRNPLGRGFVVKNVRAAVDGLPLPNIEDPEQRLTPEKLITGEYLRWEAQPMPQGFGWFPKTWYPRAPLAGVMPADRAFEQELRKHYEQVVPPEQRDLYRQTQLPDMDFRFFNGASPGLVASFLTGDEEVKLDGLSPEGAIGFQLPGERPRIGLEIGFGLSELEVVLHTVMIRVEERRCDLVWRGCSTYPGPDWLPQMRKLTIDIE